MTATGAGVGMDASLSHLKQWIIYCGVKHKDSKGSMAKDEKDARNAATHPPQYYTKYADAFVALSQSREAVFTALESKLDKKDPASARKRQLLNYAAQCQSIAVVNIIKPLRCFVTQRFTVTKVRFMFATQEPAFAVCEEFADILRLVYWWSNWGDTCDLVVAMTVADRPDLKVRTMNTVLFIPSIVKFMSEVNDCAQKLLNCSP